MFAGRTSLFNDSLTKSDLICDDKNRYSWEENL